MKQVDKSLANNDENTEISSNLEKLRELVRTKTTDERFNEIRQIIHSLVERFEYARYHYQAYRDIIDSKIKPVQHLKLFFQEDNESYWENIGITANIIACFQSLHAVHDVLAHLISYALNIEFENERRISLRKIYNRRELKEFSTLYKLLQELIEYDYFNYISAMVNHSKHKYSIAPSKSFNLHKQPNIICSFKAFSHHGDEYPEIIVDELYKLEFKRELRLIIRIENSLIAILESQKIEDN